MNAYSEPVWSKETANFKVILDVTDEDFPVDVGDDGETAAAVDSGELCHFVARVRVIHKRTGTELGTDYLGGCIYDSPEAFVDHREAARSTRELRAKESERNICCGSYFGDMVREAIREARTKLVDLQSVPVHLRG